MKSQTIKGGQVRIDLGELERGLGLFAAGIVRKRVDAALELAEEEPSSPLGPHQHARTVGLEVGKRRLDRVWWGGSGVPAIFEPVHGTRPSRTSARAAVAPEAAFA